MINRLFRQPNILNCDDSPKQSVTKKRQNVSIIQAFKINIHPKLTKRYLQSAKKCQSPETKNSFTNLENGNLQSSKPKKSMSQMEISKYFFEPLNNLQRFGSLSHYQQAQILNLSKKKIHSSKSPTQNSFNNILKQSNHENIEKSRLKQQSTVPELNSISFIKLKNQKQTKSSLKQNSSILRGSNKKQQQSILKKSSATKQSVSFAFLPQSEKKSRQSMYIGSRQQNQKKQENKMARFKIGAWDQISSREEQKNELVSRKAIIKQENEAQE